MDETPRKVSQECQGIVTSHWPSPWYSSPFTPTPIPIPTYRMPAVNIFDSKPQRGTPKVKFPDNALITSFYQRHPEARFEPLTFDPSRPSKARLFVDRQLELMNHQGLTQLEAQRQAEEEYKLRESGQKSIIQQLQEEEEKAIARARIAFVEQQQQQQASFALSSSSTPIARPMITKEDVLALDDLSLDHTISSSCGFDWNVWKQNVVPELSKIWATRGEVHDTNDDNDVFGVTSFLSSLTQDQFTDLCTYIQAYVENECLHPLQLDVLMKKLAVSGTWPPPSPTPEQDIIHCMKNKLTKEQYLNYLAGISRKQEEWNARSVVIKHAVFSLRFSNSDSSTAGGEHSPPSPSASTSSFVSSEDENLLSVLLAPFTPAERAALLTRMEEEELDLGRKNLLTRSLAAKLEMTWLLDQEFHKVEALFEELAAIKNVQKLRSAKLHQTIGDQVTEMNDMLRAVKAAQDGLVLTTPQNLGKELSHGPLASVAVVSVDAVNAGGPLGMLDKSYRSLTGSGGTGGGGGGEGRRGRSRGGSGGGASNSRDGGGMMGAGEDRGAGDLELFLKGGD